MSDSAPSPPDAPAPLQPGAFHLGCAVWGHPGWVGPVFPAGTPPRRHLEEYARRFTAVEGNSVFHGLPLSGTVERWRATMPEGFQVLPKLPREVTHEGPLSARFEERDVALRRLALLGARCGPILLQLPPRYGPSMLDDLLGFLDAWPATAPAPLVEFRHLGWFSPEVAPRLHAALCERAIGRVILDTRPVYDCEDDPQRDNPRKKPRLPVPIEPPGRRVMLRFIAHPHRERNERWLPRWAELIDGWLREGREVYAFCHCPDEDHSPWIARRLQQHLEERGARVPRLPWNGVQASPRQARLF